MGDELSSIKIELEEDDTLLLEDVVLHYPDTKTLKYKSKGDKEYRAVVKVRVSMNLSLNQLFAGCFIISFLSK